MKSALTFSQAVEGYLLAAQARRLSDQTIADYHNKNAIDRRQVRLYNTDEVFPWG